MRAAFEQGESVQLLLVHRDEQDPAVLELVARGEGRGAVVWRGSEGDLTRMSHSADAPRLLAMIGPPVATDLDGLCARGGATWLLHQAAYPSNVGFAVRTAEVSGAEGVIVDARFNHEDRSRVSHVSMGADRLLPLLWATTEQAFAAARAHGLRVIAIEAPDERAGARSQMLWDVELSGDVLLVAGNERHGIAPELLAQCDAIANIPMAGFVPSYNLHAAIAAVATERLRQIAVRF